MISIVVGLYNEEKILPSFIKTFFKCVKLKEDFELILIDDGSRDKTKDIALKFKKKYPKIKLISYHPNKGLGNALRTGFKHAKGRIIVTMDADLAHHPKYIKKLIGLLNKGYDLVIGSRYVKGGGIKGVPMNRLIISKFINIVTRIVILTNFKDLTSGFRAYNASKLKQIKSKANGFDIEVEILVKLMKKKAKIIETPIRAPVDRQAGESTFSLLKDSLDYIMGLFKIILHRWF